MMRYGFEIGDGWYHLIFDLSKNIESQARLQGIDSESNDWPVAIQVKEKFGALKFYCSMGNKTPQEQVIEKHGDLLSARPFPNNEAIANLIRSAEKASTSICERCGSKGVLRRHSWVKTLCDSCDNTRTEGYISTL
jgi:ssDNA-binding Zn-finger/Zn-ribbon topoisomerase 1